MRLFDKVRTLLGGHVHDPAWILRGDVHPKTGPMVTTRDGIRRTEYHYTLGCTLCRKQLASREYSRKSDYPQRPDILEKI